MSFVPPKTADIETTNWTKTNYEAYRAGIASGEKGEIGLPHYYAGHDAIAFKAGQRLGNRVHHGDDGAYRQLELFGLNTVSSEKQKLRDAYVELRASTMKALQAHERYKDRR